MSWFWPFGKETSPQDRVIILLRKDSEKLQRLKVEERSLISDLESLTVLRDERGYITFTGSEKLMGMFQRTDAQFETSAVE